MYGAKVVWTRLLNNEDWSTNKEDTKLCYAIRDRLQCGALIIIVLHFVLQPPLPVIEAGQRLTNALFYEASPGRTDTTLAFTMTKAIATMFSKERGHLHARQRTFHRSVLGVEVTDHRMRLIYKLQLDLK